MFALLSVIAYQEKVPVPALKSGPAKTELAGPVPVFLLVYSGQNDLSFLNGVHSFTVAYTQLWKS